MVQFLSLKAAPFLVMLLPGYHVGIPWLYYFICNLHFQEA